MPKNENFYYVFINAEGVVTSKPWPHRVKEIKEAEIINPLYELGSDATFKIAVGTKKYLKEKYPDLNSVDFEQDGQKRRP